MNRNDLLRSFRLIGLLAIAATCTDGPVGTPAGEPPITPQMAKVNNQAPVADPGGPYAGTVNTAVTFDGSRSADPDGPSSKLTYEWRFGDGATGSGAKPHHTYTAVGTYTVTLVVKDTRERFSDPASTIVTVERANEAPMARAGGPYSGTAGSTIPFDGSASSDPDGDLPLTYAWNFGDGATGTGAIPTHTYAAAGSYTVTLTVTDARGRSSAPDTTSATIAESANQAPVAHAGGPYSGTAGSTIPFDGSASSDPDGDVPLTYAWNFGDGATGTGASPTHTYATGGSYTVTLTVTDAKGRSSAPDSASATIAQPANQAPVARAGGPYSGTAGSAIAFNGSASSDPDGDLPLTYAWNFGDGGTGTGAMPTHAYAAAGTYTVTLTVTDAKRLSSAPASAAVSVSPAMIMKDTFSRLLSQGWGNAEIGGGWYTSTSGPTFRVDGDRGIIEIGTLGQQANVVGVGPVHGVSTMPGYGLDVAGLASFQIDRMPDASTSRHTVQVYARRNDRLSDGDYYYRFRLRVNASSMELAIEKNVATILSSVTSTTSIPFDPTARWWIRWEVFGVSPSTTVRMRAWKAGTPEPTTWHRSAVVDEPALDQSGTTGVRFSLPISQTTFPVRLYIDDLQYTRKIP